MKYISGETRLSAINMPGTHDSGTKYVTQPENETQCQDLSIQQQLEAGV